ncbi:MAG: heavy metal translocating P-type ATPase metal-binding domain-containing protein [Verrucomicrobia bacterium]|nr:heavy metal translocating P-type ATPase metal-binding domain-containing protein [Verrucomicrobiota bacterium]
MLAALISFVNKTQRISVTPLSADSEAAAACFHCGTPCGHSRTRHGDKSFCCQGCLTVFELLVENGLGEFYELNETAGVRVNQPASQDRFRFLDEPAVREKLVDFTDAQVTRITFHTPAIHCIACVWLLENLFRIKPGLGQSRVNFPRKEVAISFASGRVKLSEVVALLASLGYEPELKFSDLQNGAKRSESRRLWLQLGLAGFAFGNIMLFSLSSYLGLDSFSGPAFKKLFGYLSLALALPVFFYSAADYWRAAWIGIRQRVLTIEVPIAAGIVALFGQSVYEIVTGRGEGYFDSLAGLLFFLLCGKWFQQKTFARLAFDRDYKSFFPLAVTRLCAKAKFQNPNFKIEERVSLSQLLPNDCLRIRNGELIPADARLVEGTALIDYSFVTGESAPVEKTSGDYLYAGGRQMGEAIEVEIVKAVSQSYLTSLWNQDAFHKEKTGTLDTLTNRYSRRFTKIVLGIAIAAAGVWAFADSSRAVKAFTSVLIVACPCALALAAPFALGSAQRALGRRNVFLKNPSVLETLARVDAVVFDKTGTLTAAGAGAVTWHGTSLSECEESWLYSLTRQSTHPQAVRVGAAIARAHFPDSVRSFHETPGGGMEGVVAGHEIWMGSADWLESREVAVVLPPSANGSVVQVAIDGKFRGCFVLAGALRPKTEKLIRDLSASCELALLSGDHEQERQNFRALFGPSAPLRFNQSPLNKLGFIRELQSAGRTVMMVGDGLNDAGALRQSDVGVAVVENIGAFSPASDIIMAAGMVPRLQEVLRFAKNSVRVVRWSFVISSLYNVVGLSIAATGNLSPIVCAILMPVSSMTVVAFACAATEWAGRRLGEVKS